MEDGTLVSGCSSFTAKRDSCWIASKAKQCNKGTFGFNQDGLWRSLEMTHLDPAGWVPKCFVNRLNTKLVMIIENLRTLAEACPTNGVTVSTQE
ncbi:hypothetical protein Pint_33006 [Pistacia integerrima]|uniref:Uncharacterized protein n=1 Tax=Pistacia integerrima TaxID=434235 RepID=A0ACC0X4K2_9ROSI|nr:hypothetical protein Pint_33006 [Pistacia integerrima]